MTNDPNNGTRYVQWRDVPSLLVDTHDRINETRERLTAIEVIVTRIDDKLRMRRARFAAVIAALGTVAGASITAAVALIAHLTGG